MLSKPSLLYASIVGIIFFSIIILFMQFGLLPHAEPNLVDFNLAESSQANPTEDAAVSVAKPNAELKVRLKIPKINVDATVESVGQTADGDMAAPQNIANAGWFKFSPFPGKVGTAVIDGHFGFENGVQTVFENLHKLRKGDKIYIEDKKGVITTFVVRESREYDPHADATEVFSANDTEAHLNLITCGGTWDETLESYPSRLVVFADKIKKP